MVVLVGHEPSDPGLDSQSPEEIAGNILAIARIRLCRRPHSADAKRCIAGLQGRQVGELGSVHSKVLVCLPGEEGEISVIALGIAAPIATTNFISDPP